MEANSNNDAHLQALCNRCCLWGLISGGALTLGAYLGTSLEPAKLFVPILAFNLLGLGAALVAALKVGAHVFKSSQLGPIYSPLILVLCLATLIAWCGESLLPITSRDALIYHLYVPKVWLQEGHTLPLAWHTWSYFPLLGSIAYGGLLQSGWEQATQFYHGLFWIMTCLLASGVARLYGVSYRAALIAALAIFTTPLSIRLAGEPMADWFLGFYSLLVTYYAWLWWKYPRPAPLLGVSASLGLMLSVKYTGLLAGGLIGLAGILAILTKMPSWRSRATCLLLLTLPAAAIVGPWLGRNLLLTGDPLYPFLFGERDSSDTYAFVGSVSPLVYRSIVYGESWWEIALIPLRMIFTGADGNTRTFDGVLTPLYLIALLPLVYWRSVVLPRGPLVIAIATLFTLHVLLAPFLHHFVTRYHFSVLGFVVIMTSLGLDWLLVRTHVIAKTLLALLLTLHVLITIQYELTSFKAREVRAHLSGEIGKEEYMGRFASESRAARFLEKNTDSDSRTFLVFTGNRYFLYNRDVRGTYASGTPFLAWLSQPDGSCKLAEHFTHQRISHLLIEESRLTAVVETRLKEDPHFFREWNRFFSSNLTLVTREGRLSLWKVQACSLSYTGLPPS